MNQPEYETISPAELRERLEHGDEITLLDVRETEEWELSRVEEARLLPLSRFAEWSGTLDPETETVVMCHHGIRSAHVCALLARAGFKKISNLAGGIDRWSVEVDRAIPRY